MNKKVNITKRDPSRGWFDKECRDSNFEVKRALPIFRRSNLVDDELGMLNFESSRENCSQVSLIFYKTEMEKNKTTTNPDSMNDAKTFGSTLRGISSKRRATGNIRKDIWLDHFSTVFNVTKESQQHDNIPVGLVNDCLSDTFNLHLNRDISYAEVSKATNFQGGRTRYFDTRGIHTFRRNYNCVSCRTFQ